MRKNLWLLGGIILVLLVFALIVMVVRESGQQPQQAGMARLEDGILPEDNIKGSRGAKVTLVEYSDFQCPACAAYYPIIKDIEKEFGDRVGIVYRHFPLKQIHINAVAAARAAEAAGMQNKFWGMHDILFDRQNAWSSLRSPDAEFAEYAQQLGLNASKFKSDMNSRQATEKVEKNFEEAERLGIQSTPTFFLNGTQISNPRSAGEFRQLIIDSLK